MSGARYSQHGLSLIEQIVFIVVVGVAVAGVLAAFNVATRGSADPLIRKQALAIAEAILEEVQLQPFTYCDPDDPAAATATGAGACATPEAIGVEGGETRSGAAPYDNVSDYHGFAMGPGIVDVSGIAIGGLSGYSVAVSVAQQGLGAVAAPEALLVTVTVTGPGSTIATLHGYRVRYAPNALP